MVEVPPVSVAIPVFNEEAVAGELLRRLLGRKTSQGSRGQMFDLQRQAYDLFGAETVSTPAARRGWAGDRAAGADSGAGRSGTPVSAASSTLGWGRIPKPSARRGR